MFSADNFTAGAAPKAQQLSNSQLGPSDDDVELQRALEASELEEAMAQSRLAAQDQLHHRVADAVPSDPALAAADDQELKLAMELSESEAKQAAKGKRVLQSTPSEEDLQRALQESANLAASGPLQQPPYAISAHNASGEGSSAAPADQYAADAELARALYESEQLAASAEPTHTAEASGPASAPMLQSPPQPSHIHQTTDATTSPSLPFMPSCSHAAHGQPTSDSTLRYPDIHLPGDSSSHSFHPQQSPQIPRQELHTRQQGAGQQSPTQGQRMPQQGQSLVPTQLQAAQRQQQQLAAGHRPPPAQWQHQHSLAQPGAGPYRDGYHGSAHQESVLIADEAIAKALQEEEYKAAKSAAGSQAPSDTSGSMRQQPGQVQRQDYSKCPGCGHGRKAPMILVDGQSWHCDCFKCTACQRPIAPGQKYGRGADDHMPYHIQCYREKFDPRCMVCHNLIPKQVMTWIQQLHAAFAMHTCSSMYTCCTHVCKTYLQGMQA